MRIVLMYAACWHPVWLDDPAWCTFSSFVAPHYPHEVSPYTPPGTSLVTRLQMLFCCKQPPKSRSAQGGTPVPTWLAANPSHSSS